MRSVLMIVVLMFCHGLDAQQQALDVRAELIWVDSEADSHRLMFSQLVGETWSHPLAVYDSESFITTPAISTDLDNNKLIIWSEQKDNSTVLMSARRASLDTIWQQAEKINDFKGENLSPSIVVDISNRLWVFWSSNYQGLDDIYYSRQQGAQWSSPSRVHANNQVPDIQPVARLDQDLNVVVAWMTYDLQTGKYLTAEQVFAIDNSSKSRYKNALSNNQQESISNFMMPDFIPRDSAVGLHFPNNKIEQSIRLDLIR